MKWLILILLVSCGKHSQPGYKDVWNENGDLIQDFVANTDSMEQVSGVMKFDESILNFSNEIKSVNDILVGPDKLNNKENYLSEWSTLYFERNKKDLNLIKEAYKVTLVFNSLKVKPKSVTYVSGSSQLDLGTWSPVMDMTLSKEKIESLVAGRAQLKLDAPQTVSNELLGLKTNRYYINDGSSSKIMYVSRRWKLDDVLNQLGVKQYEEVVLDKILALSGKVSPMWYVRKFNNGDTVISYTNELSIIKQFKNRFETSRGNIERINGTSSAALKLKTTTTAAVHFKIRPTRIWRDFSEKSESNTTKSDSTFDGVRTYMVRTCHSTTRSITNEMKVPAILEDFLNHVSITSSGNVLPFDQEYLTIDEYQDEKGIFFLLSIHSPWTELELSVNTLPDQTFTQVGTIAMTCNGKNYQPMTTKTNPEAKLSFEIESYVEKNL